MLSDLLVLSAPLSLPSLYLAYRLHKRGYLGTVFNRQMAMVLVFAGEDINRTAKSLAEVRSDLAGLLEPSGVPSVSRGVFSLH